MGTLSISNKKHSIRSIIWNVQGWKNGIFIGIGETNSPDWIWMVATQVTYIPFGVSLSGIFFKQRSSYWRLGYIPLPDKRKYNTQSWDDPTIQHFMWGDSSELKLENNKGSVLDGLHVRNQVTINDEKVVFLRSRIWIHSLWHRFPQIYISYLEPIIISRKKGNPDSDTMDVNTLFRVTHKACVAHSSILIQWKTSTVYSLRHMSHQRYFGKTFIIRV